ncbi:hypothetical protein F5Y13DRAFT_126316 [Hypoxylon sp. FL1857]|nr:hypothetical protein F5Y13DRAFT_126316 [Hypoxylon sp. FL1857]
MPRSATSPSDFIYRKAQGLSTTLSRPSDPIMELTEPSVSRVCRPRESLATNHAPWEAEDCRLPEPTQTNRRATVPATQVFRRAPQPEVPCEIYAPADRLCFVRQYQPGALDAHPPGLPPEAMASQYCSEPAYNLPPYLPTAAIDPQCVSNTVSNSPPQQYFPIPLAEDIASPKDLRTPSTTSGVGSRTLSVHSSSPERTQRICDTVRAVHDICLQSTKTFLDSHLANRRARMSNSADGINTSLDQSKAGTSNNPTSDGGTSIDVDSTKATNKPNININSSHSPIPRPSNSLLNNISSICSMLWAGSQRDRLDVLNVERAAVENMGRILCWAETVALGDYDEWTIADEEALRQVLEAGRSLCDWLQVPDGIQGMRALESDVMGPGFGVL